MNAINQLVLDENNTAFNPVMGNSYKLNDLGRDILVHIRDEKSKDQIVDALLEKYDVSHNELFIDVSDFFAKLKVYGLL